MIILNVDDRPDNRYLFETILRAAGHEVLSAADGAEGLGILRQTQCDLIVSDVVMPGMDGFQFCREVKSDPATRGVPFVFFTAVYTEANDEAFARSLGAVDFLVKPLEPDDLVAALLAAAQQPAATVTDALVSDPSGFLEEYNRRVVQKLETKLAEIEHLNARLHESETRLRSVVEGTSDAISVKDQRGRYLAINSAGARFLGQPAERILGRTDAELYDADTALRRSVAEQRLLQFGLVETCEESVRLPGESAARHFHSVRGPMRDDSGTIVGTFGIARDLTERRRAEEQIRKLSRAVEQSPLSVVITNADGVIEYVNPHFTTTTGYSAAEALGQNPRVLKSGSQSTDFYADLWRTIKEGHEWRGLFENRRKNGEAFTEQAVIAPLKNESGAITHFIAIKEDITERLRLQGQLRQSQKMDAIGRLAGGVAHDFNNLLTIIQLEASALASLSDLGEDAAAGLKQIHAATTRATALTRQLLAFSRHQNKEERTVELRELVEDLAKLLRRILGEDINLVTRTGPEPIAIRADPGMIEQALLNLAVNARDAMPGGGTLQVCVDVALIDDAYVHEHPGSSAGYRAHLQVSDSGTGISAEHVSRIFEPFFTTKAAGKGTGLGLATVYGAVQQHHGWITVESEVARGTTFHLFLPALTHLEAENADDATTGPLPRGQETVLLAEDDEQIRHLVQVALERQGYRVLSAPDGAEAANLLAAHPDKVSLLVTDLIMPGGLDGVGLAARARAQHPSIRVLYISGYPADVVAQHLKHTTGLHFLRKPFSIRALLEAVRRRLDE